MSETAEIFTRSQNLEEAAHHMADTVIERLIEPNAYAYFCIDTNNPDDLHGNGYMEVCNRLGLVPYPVEATDSSISEPYCEIDVETEMLLNGVRHRQYVWRKIIRTSCDPNNSYTEVILQTAAENYFG